MKYNEYIVKYPKILVDFSFSSIVWLHDHLELCISISCQMLSIDKNILVSLEWSSSQFRKRIDEISSEKASTS